jgi:ABC-type sugar transport system substrate-binding protein
MTTALRNNEKIDLVYGHNDPMAYGAYLAAKDAGRDKDIKFRATNVAVQAAMTRRACQILASIALSGRAITRAIPHLFKNLLGTL